MTNEEKEYVQHTLMWHKTLVISWVAKQLLVHQEELFTMKLSRWKIAAWNMDLVWEVCSCVAGQAVSALNPKFITVRTKSLSEAESAPGWKD
jgi:hypothetical protein